MKILVTGANGFVGKPLCEFLCQEGHHVIAVIRRELPTSYWNISKNLSICQLKIHRDTVWEKVLTGVDVVIHLAARVHVMKEHESDPLTSYRGTNRDGTEQLAKEATKAGVKRFVYISSAKVNGEQTQSKPFSEANEANPSEPYAQSKWEAEKILMSIAQKSEMEYVILRPPLVYGPGVGANFAALVNWVKTKKPLPFAAVKNKRSYISLDNLLSAINTVIHHPKAANQLFLVSDGFDLSTPELINKIDPHAKQWAIPTSLLWGIAYLTRQTPKARRLLESFQLDIQKIQQLLGWTPKL